MRRAVLFAVLVLAAAGLLALRARRCSSSCVGDEAAMLDVYGACWCVWTADRPKGRR